MSHHENDKISIVRCKDPLLFVTNLLSAPQLCENYMDNVDENFTFVADYHSGFNLLEDAWDIVYILSKIPKNDRRSNN